VNIPIWHQGGDEPAAIAKGGDDADTAIADIHSIFLGISVGIMASIMATRRCPAVAAGGF
jgi:hypothetical protein